MTRTNPDLADVYDETQVFPHQFESLLLATVGADGHPDASYAAYVFYEGDYYIYVSELSRHTINLSHTPLASLLFIESEEQAQHLFARRRLTLDCKALEVPRDSDWFDSIFEAFETRFGKFMQMLRTLNDFHLFRLRPNKGAYVRGFAQAYALEGDSLNIVRHMNERGHNTTSASTRRQMDDVLETGHP